MAEGTIAVEIGPRQLPMLPYIRKALQGDHLIYVEREGNWLSALKKIVGKDQVIRADASALPFKGESIDNVFMANVFGFQGVPDITKRGWAEDTALNINIGDFKRIATEIFRVCKIGGKVTVLESATPADFDTVESAFKGAGFKTSEMYRGKENVDRIFGEDLEGRALGIGMKRLAAGDSYALVFEK